jgi:U3 small nucleolar RNA-associated protein 14
LQEALAVKELSLEEARARRERLAKLRSLLFYHELKAKRLKKIKSKEFHRKAAKVGPRAEQLVLSTQVVRCAVGCGCALPRVGIVLRTRSLVMVKSSSAYGLQVPA